jgi:chromosome segregation ATPase
MLTIETKVDGKKTTLELNANEVASAISICERGGAEEVIIMKKPVKGGALCFINSAHANACQDRHNIEHAFTVKLSELKKFKPSEAPAKKADPKDEEIASLKDEVQTLRDEAEANADKVDGVAGLEKTIGDKDAEIELLKEEGDKKTEALTDADEKIKALGEEIAGLNAQITELKKK